MASNPKPPVATGYPAAAQPSYAAAYPYPAPYYPPPPQPVYHAAPPQRFSAAQIRRFFALVAAVFFVVAAVSIVVWLVLRPRVPEFSVSSLRLSSVNLSSSLLSSDFDLDLAVRNPNTKLSASYDRVAAAVLFRSAALAETSLPPFHQPKRTSTTLHARMAARDEYVGPDVASHIQSQRTAAGAVSFDVRLSAVARFRAGWWRMRTSTMQVYCGDLRVIFSNATAGATALASPPTRCRVEL